MHAIPIQDAHSEELPTPASQV